MKDFYTKLAIAGNKAPSGDNCQPWRFDVSADGIDVSAKFENDRSLYSFKDRPTYIAIGAAIENMAVLAASLGYDLSISYSEFKHTSNIARITASRGEQRLAALADAIDVRHTNRQPYTSEQMTDMQAASCGIEGSPAYTTLITKTADVKRLGQIAALNETVLFQNEDMHRFFFTHILWNEADHISGKEGLYIKTLSLPAPAEKMFKLASDWKRAKFMCKCGFATMITKVNGILYGKSSGIGAVILNTNDTAGYIAAGRVMQRTWLQATAAGLQFQPLTGVALLANRILDGGHGSFTATQQTLLTEGYRAMKDVFDLSDSERIVLMFRVGIAKPARVKSNRLTLSV